LKDRRFLGEDTFVEHVHRRFNDEPSFFYDISIGEIVSEVSSALNISIDNNNRISSSKKAKGEVAEKQEGGEARRLGG